MCRLLLVFSLYLLSGRAAPIVRDGDEISSQRLAQLLLSLNAPASTSQAFAQSRTARGSIPMAKVSSRREAMTQAAILGATFIPAAANAADFPKIRMETSLGDVTFLLYDDVAPNTVANFVKLANEGFYDGQAFFAFVGEKVPIYMKGGDPTTKKGYAPDGSASGPGSNYLDQADWGTGGPGYKIENEPNALPFKFGSLISVPKGPTEVSGSQFAIVLQKPKDNEIPKRSYVFGQLIEDGVGDRNLKKARNTYGTADRPEVPARRVGIEKITVG
jgi:cyclophilin family peptidyl-prolyl cis-trans isomerase